MVGHRIVIGEGPSSGQRTPGRFGKDGNDVGVDELYTFGGTSASGPFLSGIVALMKMLDSELTYEQVRSILVSTSNPSSDAKVKDRGYVDAYRAVKAVSPNLPPTVEILEPAGGSEESYRTVFFKARVTDPESPSPLGVGADFSSTVRFRSNRDGELCTASGDATNGGTTVGCEVAALSIGSHTITATATDPFEGVGTDSIAITVVNHQPIAKITYPASSSTFTSNQPINFRGYAFDEDTFGAIPLAWSWDLDGPLETSDDFWASLSVGDHQITLTATDEQGATASDTITLHVVSAPVGGGYPAVQITQPANLAIFDKDALITFTGQATDPEDGDIVDNASFQWFSSVDGSLGTGRTLQRALSSDGSESTEHTITLEVTDKDGHKGSHSINVMISDIQ